MNDCILKDPLRPGEPLSEQGRQRRWFVKAAGATLFVAPAIVKAENIMKIWAPDTLTILTDCSGDPWTIDAAGNIAYVGAKDAMYTLLQLHRWLQDQADNAYASGDNMLDITAPNPSLRMTDNLIILNDEYDIDIDALSNLEGGTLEVKKTKEIYSSHSTYELGKMTNRNQSDVLIIKK